MFKRILVPTDGSDITAKAINTALDLARAGSGQMFAVSVKEPFPYSAISEMQPVPPQEFYDAQERISAGRVKALVATSALGMGYDATLGFVVNLGAPSSPVARSVRCTSWTRTS